ncbi:MAG: OmpA family protein [Acidobacteria bacterium]|nr:OmpA family protein [Acidobacteriota bacterium]
MQSLRAVRLAALLCGVLPISILAQNHPKDARGSSDHPLFPNRMPGYVISNYQPQGFASYSFKTRPVTAVEGKYTRIGYYLEDPKAHPGGLAIRRNYEAAIQRAGGVVVHSDDNLSVLKASRGGVEVWVEIQAPLKYSGRYYYLHIVEKEAMRQVITADAMSASIDRDGFVALDIRFATGRAEILPESTPVVAEIAAMLTKRPALKVGVEGHTDDTGTPAGNLTLSQLRAEAVASALRAAGIAGTRLVPVGFGQTKPIGDNRSEEGRAKNRRVEIVRK